MKLKTQKGITLIALIITIIVMLILVGVTVTVALNGGLFSTAGKATGDTETERDKELALSDEQIEINGQKYASYEDYLNNNPIIENGSWQQDRNEIKYVTESGTVVTSLMIGDKVNYDETDGTPLPYETDDSKGTGISFDVNSYTLNQGTYALNADGTTIEAGDLEWRVLGLNDGGQLELVSATPTTSTLVLGGEMGYENAVTDENGNLGTLDTFCNNLYGQGDGAQSARSLTAEDINKLANYDPATMYTGYGEYTYKTFVDATYRIKTSEITDENRDNSTEWENLGAYGVYYNPFDDDGFLIINNTFHSYDIADYIDITTRDLVNFSDVLISENSYWLATQIVTAGWMENHSVFVLSTTGKFGWGCESYADSSWMSGSARVRPVVTLELDVIPQDTNADNIFEIKN